MNDDLQKQMAKQFAQALIKRDQEMRRLESEQKKAAAKRLARKRQNKARKANR